MNAAEIRIARIRRGSTWIELGDPTPLVARTRHHFGPRCVVLGTTRPVRGRLLQARSAPRELVNRGIVGERISLAVDRDLNGQSVVTSSGRFDSRRSQRRCQSVTIGVRISTSLRVLRLTKSPTASSAISEPREIHDDVFGHVLHFGQQVTGHDTMFPSLA